MVIYSSFRSNQPNYTSRALEALPRRSTKSRLSFLRKSTQRSGFEIDHEVGMVNDLFLLISEIQVCRSRQNDRVCPRKEGGGTLLGALNEGQDKAALAQGIGYSIRIRSTMFSYPCFTSRLTLTSGRKRTTQTMKRVDQAAPISRR